MEDLQNTQLELYTQLKKLYSNYKKTPKERYSTSYFQTRLEILESQSDKFNNNHDVLVTISKEEKSKLLYFKEDMYDSYLEFYLDFKSQLKDRIGSFQTSTISSETENKSQFMSAKLPRIEIPKFSGDYKEWLSFHDIFKSMIHENPTLSNVSKCQYLKACLIGEAENLVKQITITDNNYQLIWNTLKERYSNQRNIVNAFIGKFLNQKKIVNESAKAIKDILDTTSECLTSLKLIGIPTEHWDDMVVYILLQKLDCESHRLFEQRIEAKDKLPTWKDMSDFLKFRFRTLESISFSKGKDTIPSTSRNITSVKSFGIYQCKEFMDLDVNGRQQYAQKNNYCFNCLKKGHSVKNCTLITTCKKCGRKHHTLLHGYSVPASNTPTPYSQQPQTSEIVQLAMVDRTDSSNIENSLTMTASTTSKTSPVILATALIIVKSNRNSNRMHTLRSLVDQGSQASLITEGACQELGLKKIPINGNIVGITSSIATTKALVEFEIVSIHNPNFKIKVNAYVLRNLSSYMPQKTHSVNWPQLNNLQLADHTFTQPGRIDVLLGAEVFAEIIQQGLLVFKTENSSLVAQQTSLGWLISGSNTNSIKPTQAFTHHVKIDIDTTLRRFWELEEVEPGKRTLTNDELKCEEHYKNTHRRDIDGRYVVQLPFKTNPPDIGESASIAMKRLAFVEKKFKKYPDLQNRYNDFMLDYLEQNHMELVSSTNQNQNDVCYLPHHAVINEQHLTTKLRVVYDASCKTSNGKSLNDNLLIGPALQGDLRNITLRWRRRAIVLVGDIRQMYRQISVEEKHRDFQRILWRFNLDEPVKHFRLTTVTYGTSCAPYLAIKTLKQLAQDESSAFPENVIDTLNNDMYVDDLLTGAHTASEMQDLKVQLISLAKKGGLVLHKWISNISDIQETRKILGIKWKNTSDKFELNFDIKETKEHPTKRSILRDIASLYDPTGWLAPVVIKAKVFLQKLWIEGKDWDDKLSAELELEWINYRKDLCRMPIIELDRWLGITNATEKIEIHGFSDASDTAYSAVVYSRVISADSMKVTLIEAKTRVAPVKKVTTPRLELCGAVLLAKLMNRIKHVLKVPVENIYAWTDATIVLAWLQRSPSYWNTFVGNRVTEITNSIDTTRWHHVASSDNPADVASRGIFPHELQSHELWWNGPSWLSDNSELPITDISEIINPIELEKRSQVKVSVQCNIVVSESEKGYRDIISRYSTLSKLVRVLSYCFRFYYKCKSKLTNENIPVTLDTTYLNTVELKNTMNILIRLSQKSDVIDKKQIQKFNPFVDDGILKIGGRLQYSCLSYDAKHPIILAKNSTLAYLIALDAHRKTLHGGIQLMLNYIRNKYHIIGVKNLVKRIYRECVICRRYNNKPINQLMGTLPRDRVTPQRPFSTSGVDFAGPVILKLFSGRGSNKVQKAYIALFVCTATKAVHIELVTSLSTESFIAAFRRFTSRRGHCKKLLSDCGTNFIGASKELEIMAGKSIVNLPSEIVELLAADGTDWQFIGPGAPHMGGLFESAVKSMKKHINRILGDTKLTYEEYSTLLCQIESCLNSRPLTSLDHDSEGTTVALTPGHFLIGENPIVVPDENLEKDNVPYNKRWIYLQQKLQSFWRKWSQEYLVTLQQRNKWTRIQENLKVGDVVLIKDERLPPSKWLMGKIIDTHPGSDGLIRIVSIKCKNSTIKRPIHKLCLLTSTD